MAINSNKKKIIIGFFLAVFLISVIVLSGVLKTSESPSVSYPSPTLIRQDKMTEWTITSVNIQDNELNVSQDKEIIILFNQNVTSNTVKYKILPNPGIKAVFSGNTLLIKPDNLWSEGTVYYLTLENPRISGNFFNLTFTVKGAELPQNYDTFPEGAYEKEQEYNRINNPEGYLFNILPFENEYFNIRGEVGGLEGERYIYFICLLKKPDYTKSRISFDSWLKSNGLEQSQKEKLFIIFNEI